MGRIRQAILGALIASLSSAPAFGQQVAVVDASPEAIGAIAGQVAFGVPPLLSLAPTTHMLLVLPEVGVDTGPTWANLLNAAFNLIDSHDHSTGKGTKVTTAGLNINADLELNSNDLTEVRSVRLESQGAALGSISTDRRALHAVGNDLYYVDGSGTAIRITLSGAVNTAASGSIVGMGGTNAAVTYSDATKVFSFTQSSNTPAKGAIGDLRIAETVSGGKGPLLKAASGTAADYDLTFPAALPGSTLPVKISSAGAISTSTIDTAQITDGAVTFAKVAAGAVVGYTRATLGTWLDLTTTLPVDGTVPQNTEGTEVLTVNYTPKKVGNKLLVRAAVSLHSASFAATIHSEEAAAAIFKDSAADALAANAITIVKDQEFDSISSSYNIDFAGASENDTSAASSQTLTGVAAGDQCIATGDASWSNDKPVGCRVTGADTIEIYYHCLTTGSSSCADPGADDFYVRAFKSTSTDTQAHQVIVEYEETVASTALATWKVRAGSHNVTNMDVNVNGKATALFGSLPKTWIEVVEVAQ